MVESVIDDEQPASPIYDNGMEAKQNDTLSSLETQTMDEKEDQSTNEQSQQKEV